MQNRAGLDINIQVIKYDTSSCQSHTRTRTHARTHTHKPILSLLHILSAIDWLCLLYYIFIINMDLYFCTTSGLILFLDLLRHIYWGVNLFQFVWVSFRLFV